MDPIGIGIIGAGYWGRKVAGEYLDAERRGNVKLVKVCDTSPAALGALLVTKETACIGQERLTTDINDILSNPEIFAVHIATPGPTHYLITKMALEAGKNVLVEKPMTLNSLECYELVELAAERDLVLEVGHIFRFDEALRVAREILSREEIGRIFYLRVQWTDLSNFPDRDIIFDLGPHPVDIVNQLLGTWPKEVSGVGRSYRNSRTNAELAYILAEYPDDIFAHIELSWLHPRKVREISIVGSAGTLVADCVAQSVMKYSSDGISEIPITPSNTIASEIDHFVDRIEHGDSAIDLTGARVVEALETIRASLWEEKIPVVAHLEKEKLTPVQDVLPNLHSAASILRSVNGGDTETGITLQDSLIPDLMQRYLIALEKLGMLKVDARDQEKPYSITPKGENFLKDFNELDADISGRKRRVLEETLGIASSRD